MGKTKTAFVTGAPQEKKTGKAAYEEKRRKKEEAKKAREAEAKKKAVKGVGLKGGERVKTVEAGPIIETLEEVSAQEKKKTRAPKIRSKKYSSAKSKIDSQKTYSLAKAIKLVKEASYSRFDGTMELHINIKPPAKNKNSFSANVSLPHSAGKTKKVEVADEKTIAKLKKASGPGSKIDFDILLATKEMMPKLVPFAKILGPKGLMPNPKNGTLIKNIKDAKKFGENSITLKAEKKAPIIHTTIGKVSQKDKELEENAEEIFKAVGKKQVVKAHLKATMSPSVKLNI